MFLSPAAFRMPGKAGRLVIGGGAARSAPGGRRGRRRRGGCWQLRCSEVDVRAYLYSARQLDSGQVGVMYH